MIGLLTAALIVNPCDSRPEIDAQTTARAVHVKFPQAVDSKDSLGSSTGMRFFTQLPDGRQIQWADEKQERPLRLRYPEKARVLDVGIGSTLAEVAASNERPFELAGFGKSMVSGQTRSWQGGKFQCDAPLVFAFRVAPGSTGAPTASSLRSDDPRWSRVKVTVGEWWREFNRR